ncbi:MAG: alpha/beta fold hydrolase, partial [Planctomycetota bacterium]
MAKTEAPRIDDVGHPPPGTKELAEIAPLLVPRSKRRWWRWCLGVVVLGSALVLLGACRMDAHARRLLAAEREAGIEPGVVRPGWGPIDAGPLDAEVAVLLIHGFRSTPRDFGELPDRLAGEGVRVRAMLLPGHGTSSEELATTTVEQWIEAVREEYRALRSRHASVRVVGYSLGGALALVALADEPPDRLALVAPYFAVAPRWYAWPNVETWARAARRLVDWIDSGPEVHGLSDRTRAA